MELNERKNKTAKAVTAVINSANALPNPPKLSKRVYDCPLMAGDVVTFRLSDDQCAGDLLGLETGSVNYYYVLDINGRKVSVKSLVGRKGNGIVVNGETVEERLKAFLEHIDTIKEVSFRVDKLRVLPSTNPEWSDQRIITWKVAE